MPETRKAASPRTRLGHHCPRNCGHEQALLAARIESSGSCCLPCAFCSTTGRLLATCSGGLVDDLRCYDVSARPLVIAVLMCFGTSRRILRYLFVFDALLAGLLMMGEIMGISSFLGPAARVRLTGRRTWGYCWYGYDGYLVGSRGDTR